MKKLRSIILASLVILLLPTQDAKAEQAARPIPEYGTQPINPFDSRGYCFHSGCPSLHLGATVSALTSNPTWPMQGNVPSYIPFIYLGIDNGGYSNWWEAHAFLVSPTGVRVPLGKGESDDGNKLENIGVSCQPLYRLNPCMPSISWFQPAVPVTTPIGVYALEVHFYMYDGVLDKIYTFGPNFFWVTGQTIQESLNGKRCTVAGATTIKDGTRYGCLKRKRGLVWRQI